jgi:23S rRNA pseudouridine2605 synthase
MPKNGVSPHVRLQKAMADAGVASRRAAETMIRQGRVTVNGRVIREMGVKIDPDHDHIKVDGRHLKPAAPKAYVMLNKPKEVVTTLKATEEDDRPIVQEFLHGVKQRMFPVGRLDYDTEGLLLLTNDGELAQKLLHPRYHVSKTYLTKVKGKLTDDEIRQLERGVRLDDGITAPAHVKKIRKAEENSWIELTIYEGRTHQVKRMLEAVGHPVLKLKRERFGPLTLGNLSPGDYRFLTDPEILRLKAATQSIPSRSKGEGGRERELHASPKRRKLAS